MLKEGIPNVKLVNEGETGAVLKVMGDGDVFDGEQLTAKLKEALVGSGATPDAAGFYVGSGSGSGRVEL